ncbi:putative acyl-CoA thioesterase [Tripterygium wilfordii]|uniref:Putative acyl-CoA thioesterase n=1 Tax=Tripterygium wilfordii TaxID=458696 RepID=A0A7J7CC40_TRIWF|nr:acyl-coenzyme A thioesterase 13-like [Tripterygium wilfordii]KAF5731703.1 putative acyl-CoA thioesterase [Tripterygium wilfordii]
MAKASGSTIISEDMIEQNVNKVVGFFDNVGVSASVTGQLSSKDFYSSIIRNLLSADRVERGRVTCSFSVKPVVSNYFRSLHGGAVGAIAERVSIACARTMVAEDKELFLGEISISYLSTAPENAEVIVDGSVVRSGRNLTVVATEFTVKKTRKLVYTTRATFYHLPSAKL